MPHARSAFFACLVSTKAFPEKGPGFGLYALKAELPEIEMLPATALGDSGSSLNAVAWDLQYTQYLTRHGFQLSCRQEAPVGVSCNQ